MDVLTLVTPESASVEVLPELLVIRLPVLCESTVECLYLYLNEMFEISE